MSIIYESIQINKNESQINQLNYISPILKILYILSNLVSIIVILLFTSRNLNKKINTILIKSFTYLYCLNTSLELCYMTLSYFLPNTNYLKYSSSSIMLLSQVIFFIISIVCVYNVIANQFEYGDNTYTSFHIIVNYIILFSIISVLSLYLFEYVFLIYKPEETIVTYTIFPFNLSLYIFIYKNFFISSLMYIPLLFYIFTNKNQSYGKLVIYSYISIFNNILTLIYVGHLGYNKTLPHSILYIVSVLTVSILTITYSFIIIKYHFTNKYYSKSAVVNKNLFEKIIDTQGYLDEDLSSLDKCSVLSNSSNDNEDNFKNDKLTSSFNNKIKDEDNSKSSIDLSRMMLKKLPNAYRNSYIGLNAFSLYEGNHKKSQASKEENRSNQSFSYNLQRQSNSNENKESVSILDFNNRLDTINIDMNEYQAVETNGMKKSGSASSKKTIKERKEQNRNKTTVNIVFVDLNEEMKGVEVRKSNIKNNYKSSDELFHVI